MGADILERLEELAWLASRSDGTAVVTFDILREAAAEIGRPRGEVSALLEDPDEVELAYRCGDPDSDAIAPAEAKGEGELPTTDAEVEADNAKAADRARLLAIANGCVWDDAAWVKPPTPQPADGGAVAEWQVWHKEDGWGATHPDNVAEYRARGVPVRPLYAHQPAPVQAAPQAYTSGHCAEKRKPGGCQLHNLHCNYPACDRKQVQAAPQEGEKAAAILRDALKYVGYRQDGDLNTLAERAELWMRESKVLIAMQQELAAHPSACELGAVRDALEAAARSLRTIAEQAGKTEGLADMMNVRGYANSRANVAELALQHRGDSRGGEG